MAKQSISKKFAKLFEPIKIGPVELNNRIAMAPMNGTGHQFGPLAYTCFYSARAAGGFGLLTTGAILTNKSGAEELAPNMPSLYPGGPHSYWWQFTEGIHSMGTGTKIFAQLSPGFGRQSGMPGAKGPSDIPMDAHLLVKNLPKSHKNWSKYWLHGWDEGHVFTPRAITVDEIHEDQATFVESASMSVQFGFDGIELHFCHGYMGHCFLSSRANNRTDEYGGSLKNRARYLLELITMLKDRFGDKVPIVVRISGDEGELGGNTAEDQRQVAKWCQDAGADAIDLSNGAGYEDLERFVGYYGQMDNFPLLEAQGKKLREAISIPVITPGLMTPDVALKAVEDGETDIVSIGRQAIADPDWPNKLKENRVDDIIKCIKDNWCLSMGIHARTSATCRCTQNPRTGFEQFIPEYWPKPMKAKLPETLKRLEPGKRLMQDT